MLISDLILDLETIAPIDLAEVGDKIGLQVGNSSSDVQRVCICLDVTDDIIQKAIDRQAELIVAHHPLIRAPLDSVTDDGPVSRRVLKLIRANVAIYVMHTNFDAAPGGTNDVLADMFGMTDCSPLVINKRDSLYKIAVFVPEEHVSAVRDEMADAGAGRIGQYTHCSFRTLGTGSFVPLPTAQPYIGGSEKLEEVAEYKLEMVCVGSWLDDVLSAMVAKHPYDEVAYDVYELANDPIEYGYGRVGNLKTETTLDAFAELVRKCLKPKYMKVEGDNNKPIRRVALCSGSGSGLYKEAARAHADLYLTGDTKHHDILDANALGLAIIDAGHYDTETPAMRLLAQRLQKAYAGSPIEFEYID
ncbi:MAG: Nif3-like dinuclear metal center hexameric protein [Armatimonadetes bacterium]|nr:Nif3-like dinuclear metal center hexameric protein [Armatimonadota bacterium]